MSLVDTDQAFFPAYFMTLGSSEPFTFDAIATNSDMLALVFQIPKTGTISNVHYRVTSATSPILTLRAELRTADMATGLPSAAGTLYGGSTSIGVADPTTGNKTAAVNATTATAGDYAAFVLDLSAFTSGSFAVADKVTDFLGSTRTSSRTMCLPYRVSGNSPAAPAKDGNGQPPQGFVLEYSSGVFVPIVGVNSWIGSFTSTTLTSGGTVRAGNIFRPKSPRRAIGIEADCNFSGAVIYRLRLASTDAVLATATPDKDVVASTSLNNFTIMFDAGATVTLAVGTDYYITMEATDATGGQICYVGSGVSQAMLDICPGQQNCYGVTSVTASGTPNAGGYTTYLTANAVRRYGICLITDQEDNGVSAGGGGGGRGVMTGGMQG